MSARKKKGGPCHVEVVFRADALQPHGFRDARHSDVSQAADIGGSTFRCLRRQLRLARCGRGPRTAAVALAALPAHLLVTAELLRLLRVHIPHVLIAHEGGQFDDPTGHRLLGHVAQALANRHVRGREHRIQVACECRHLFLAELAAELKVGIGAQAAHNRGALLVEFDRLGTLLMQHHDAAAFVAVLSLGAQKYSGDDQRQEHSPSHGWAAKCQRRALRGRLVRELSVATASAETPAAAVICPTRKPVG